MSGESSDTHGSPIMAGNVHDVSDAVFQAEVLDSSTPVLVDFWATWCGPCLMLAPTIDALATEYAGKLKVVKVDVDKNRQSAVQYRIDGIPALMLFKDGQIVDRMKGAGSKEQIKNMINKHVA